MRDLIAAARKRDGAGKPSVTGEAALASLQTAIDSGYTMPTQANLCPPRTSARVDLHRPGAIDSQNSTTAMREFAEYMSQPSRVLFRIANAGQEYVSLAEH